jgi:hypothetical protein
VINPLSNRPSPASYVPPKTATTPVAEGGAFQEVAARAAADRQARASVDENAFQPGVQPWLAFELAARRQPAKSQATTSVPKDYLWALTGTGQAASADPADRARHAHPPQDPATPRLDLRA